MRITDINYFEKNLTICNWKKFVFLILSWVMVLPFLYADAIDAQSDYVLTELDEDVWSGTLTLDRALELSEHFNAALIAKRLELGIAEGQLRQASIYFQNNPEISLGLARRRISSSDGSAQFTEGGVELSQEIELWGQPRARREAAEAERELVLAEIETALWQVRTDVRDSFYATQIAAQQLNLAKSQAKFTQSVLVISKRRLDVGDISRTEYRQLEIQMGALKSQTVRAEAAYKRAEMDLRLSIGMPMKVELDQDVELKSPEQPSVPLEMLTGSIISSNPRRRLASLNTERLRREEVLTRKEAKANVTGSVFWDTEEGNTNIFGIGLGFSLRVFNRQQGSIQAAEAAVEVSESEETALEFAMVNAIRVAYKTLEANANNAILYRESILPDIQKNLLQLENSFNLGEISIIELRVNQRELLDAQSEFLDIVAEYYRQLAVVEGLFGSNIPSGNEFSIPDNQEQPYVE